MAVNENVQSDDRLIGHYACFNARKTLFLCSREDLNL